MDLKHAPVWYSLICVTWLRHMCDMTPSYVWHDSLSHMDLKHAPKSSVFATTFTLSNYRNTFHRYNRCCRSTSESCHTYAGVMSHKWGSHVTRMRGGLSVSLLFQYTHTRAHAVTRSLSTSYSQTRTRTKSLSHEWERYVGSTYIYAGVMSQLWGSHVTHMRESCHTYEGVMSHIRESHVTHMRESCHSYEWVKSGWVQSEVQGIGHVTHMNE